MLSYNQKEKMKKRKRAEKILSKKLQKFLTKSYNHVTIWLHLRNVVESTFFRHILHTKFFMEE